MRLSAPVSRPIAVALPEHGVFFAESVHDATFQMAWRRDPFHKLIYLLQGSTVCEQAGLRRETPLPQGALLIVPAEVEHRFRDEKPSILRLLCLSPEFIRADPDVAQLWDRLLRTRHLVF